MDMSDEMIKDRMPDGRMVLCGCNAYDKKYYFNPAFNAMPDYVKEELKIISVLFTEEAGGVFLIVFDADGNVEMETQVAEEDILYDEITSGLLIREIRRNRQELFEQLQLFYRVFILKEDISLDEE